MTRYSLYERKLNHQSNHENLSSQIKSNAVAQVKVPTTANLPSKVPWYRIQRDSQA